MASTKVIKKITTAPENKIATATKDTPVIEEKDNSQPNDESTANDHPEFRAVGIIKGEVKFNDDDKKNPLSIVIGNKEYGIHCATRHFEKAPKFMKLPKPARPKGNKKFDSRNKKILRKSSKPNIQKKS